MGRRGGHEEEAHQAILQLIEPSRAEPGNVFYQPNRDPENPRVFFFYEQYTGQRAFEVQDSSEHFQRLGLEAASSLLESRERVFYEAIGPLNGQIWCLCASTPPGRSRSARLPE